MSAMGTVSDYVAGVDEARRPAVSAVIDAARAHVPDVTEGTSYGMPALLYRGKALLSCMATKGHLAIYPYSGKVVADVAPRLEGYSLSSGTIRFSETQPLPDGLVEEVLDLRMREIDEPGFRRR